MKKAFRRNWLEEESDDIALEYLSTPRLEDHNYVTGIDLGRKRDATVIRTFDVTYEKAVLAEHKRIPPSTADWGLIEEAIRDTFDKYEPEMIHDATGVGDFISERILDISEPFIITASSKYNIIENLRRAMDMEAIQIPRLQRAWREYEEYKWDDRNIVQDIVIADALATSVFYQPDDIWTGAIDMSYVEDSA